MASFAKTLSSAKAQSAIRARAAGIARSKIEAVKKEFKGRIAQARTRALPVAKDLMSMAINPVATGAAGALLFDMAAKPIPLLNGARGDVMKSVAAIGIGYFGRKYLRHPYLQSALMGAAIVNAHRFATRILNRGAAGVLSGLFVDGTDVDLSGYALSDPYIAQLAGMESDAFTMPDREQLGAYDELIG